MIIKKLVLNDFFRYYGEQAIDCTIEKDKNVIILIGDNGRGKTTFLSAFYWVLYDEVLEPLTIDTMLNKNKITEMDKFTTATVSVEMTFEEGNQDYIIRREMRFMKDSEGDIKIYQKSKVNIFRIEQNGNNVELNDKLFIEKLIIPKDLSGFFFFDGERIHRLAKVDGKKEIKNAILNILGISSIDSCQNDLKKVKNTIRNELKQYSSGTEVESLISEIQQKDSEIEKYEKKIQENKMHETEAESKIESLDKTISESGDAKVTLYENDKLKAEKHKNESCKRLKDIEKRLRVHIGENFKYYLAKNFIYDSERILNEKKKDGVLPSNIKTTFIDDLIEREKCICGTCLTKGSEEYNRVVSMKETAGSIAMDSAYFNLKNLISVVKEKSQSFYIQLDELCKEREDCQHSIDLLDKEIEEYSQKLMNIDIELIKNAEKCRTELKLELANLIKENGKIEAEVDALIKKKISLEKKIQIAKTNNKQALRCNEKLHLVEKLNNINNDFKDVFTEYVREQLDERIKSVFANITNKDYRVPVLTKDFELRITNKFNQAELEEGKKQEEVLSTGEGQITSLSFIGALVSFARETKENEFLSKLSGDDYPIVMDSPFGNLDEVHTRNVAANIGHLASQVIIIVSEKQWKGHVEENIMGQVNAKYIMKDGDIDGGEITNIIKEV